jgi:hypothetical protein
MTSNAVASRNYVYCAVKDWRLCKKGQFSPHMLQSTSQEQCWQKLLAVIHFTTLILLLSILVCVAVCAFVPAPCFQSRLIEQRLQLQWCLFLQWCPRYELLRSEYLGQDLHNPSKNR